MSNTEYSHYLIFYLTIYLAKKNLFLKELDFLKRFYLFIFRERGREGDREEEKHQCVVASHMTPTGDWPAIQACSLTGNQTSYPLVCSPCSIH